MRVISDWPISDVEIFRYVKNKKKKKREKGKVSALNV